MSIGQQTFVNIHFVNRHFVNRHFVKRQTFCQLTFWQQTFCQQTLGQQTLEQQLANRHYIILSCMSVGQMVFDRKTRNLKMAEAVYYDGRSLYFSLARKTNWSGRLSTVDLHIKVACFVKYKNKINNLKGSWFDLNKLVQGGERYWAWDRCILV